METRAPGAVAIVLAAGAGRRVGGDRPKAFLPIGDRSILAVATASAAAARSIDRLVVTVPAGWENEAEATLADLEVPVTVVTGGATRQASVGAALAVIGDGSLGATDIPLAPPAIVAVHDAARPFASPELFDDVTAALDGTDTMDIGGFDGAIPVVPIADTVKRIEGGMVTATLSREGLGAAQTPQAFRIAPLRAAHEAARAEGLDLTDDAAVIEAAGGTVRAVTGDPANVKITTFLDLARADARMGGAETADA